MANFIREIGEVSSNRKNNISKGICGAYDAKNNSKHHHNTRTVGFHRTSKQIYFFYNFFCNSPEIFAFILGQQDQIPSTTKIFNKMDFRERATSKTIYTAHGAQKAQEQVRRTDMLDSRFSSSRSLQQSDAGARHSCG